ncbi:putative MFS myo-inositol transporter [Aspergillus brunneoviolaceus CBS 621.78]|uniref:General substrate transporter n=1 Tax=Aspergillus brunneoviolaceus CBS 621.78 TaxID=1450534 RepID=A0ACD1FX07_9EURO|nr:general substrate transporter [Aspergillus brunneoviolaceus CBS 621.78]RAH41490.1 general substrate transporter [Aspergillus brunneoviolaceus CBS 621.78]
MSRRDENEVADSSAPLLSQPSLANRASQRDDGDARVPRPSLTLTGDFFIWSLTFSAGISGLLFGYDTGVISSTLVSIGSDLSNRSLTTLDKSLVTSCTSLFALVASPLAGILADKFGRKKVIIIADVLFTLGAFIQAVATTVWAMIVGRSVVGLAVGGASLVTPLYISELAPSHERGRLVTILCLLITGGQVIAYIVGWLLSNTPGGWRYIVGLGMVPAIFQCIAVGTLPETPRWLVQAGLENAATNVLLQVYQAHDENVQIVESILHDIQQEVADEAEITGHSNKSPGHSENWVANATQRTRSLFLVGGNRRALIIAVILQGLQQLCGFNSLLYFSSTLFAILSFSSPTLTALAVAMTNFVFTLLAFIYIDRIGRRRILLYSIPVMALSLVACAMAFGTLALPRSSFEPEGSNGADAAMVEDSLLPLLVLICLTVYTASYAFGLGNVPWQQSELFPLNVRSLGSSLATATNWGSNFIVGLTFLPMMEWLSPAWTFATYAAVCVLGWIGVWAIYPEMSGLSLEEVKDLLANGWGVQESQIRGHGRP